MDSFSRSHDHFDVLSADLPGYISDICHRGNDVNRRISVFDLIEDEIFVVEVEVHVGVDTCCHLRQVLEYYPGTVDFMILQGFIDQFSVVWSGYAVFHDKYSACFRLTGYFPVLVGVCVDIIHNVSGTRGTGEGFHGLHTHPRDRMFLHVSVADHLGSGESVLFLRRECSNRVNLITVCLPVAEVRALVCIVKIDQVGTYHRGILLQTFRIIVDVGSCSKTVL